ncbi:cytochrome P450 3A8-like [Oppia nitens]|uniref:cytochrome P450 3A8-like n=1 Tax=Oppia nitens TaxID=1686743 RepID=UPI0023D9CEF4|nr:cytochrome P450 3A8-like [Oppia nitens]
MDWVRKYGKVFGLFFGNEPVLVISDPQLIKQICIKDWHVFINRSQSNVTTTEAHPILQYHLDSAAGREWQRLRGIVTQIFTGSKIKSMIPKIHDCTMQMCRTLDPLAATGPREGIGGTGGGQVVDMKEFYVNYVMDSTATTVYAVPLDSNRQPKHPFVQNTRQLVSPNWYRSLLFLLLPQSLLNLFGLKFLIPDSVNEYFFDVTRRLIHDRNNDSNRYNDFVKFLLKARIDDNTIDEYNIYEKGMKKFLNDDEIVGTGWSLIGAGYEARVLTLSFGTYELAMNPELQERLYGEVMTAFFDDDDSASDGHRLDYEKMIALPLLEAFINETLRLHTSAIREGRMAVQDYWLGDTGLLVKKGEQVEFPFYAIHHCPDYYPNPEAFLPERFLPENRHKLVPYTFMPFGMGARQCVAMRFAYLEFKYVFCQLIRRYRFARSPQTDIPPRITPNTAVYSPQRILVNIVSR